MPAIKEPNLGLNYGWSPGESGWNNQMDENFRAIGAVMNGALISATTTTPPAEPAAGDRYVIPAGATGVWADHVGKMARRNLGAWELFTPREGWEFRALDTGQRWLFQNGQWVVIGGDITEFGTVVTYNVGTAPEQIPTNSMAMGLYEHKRLNNLTATTDPTVSDDSTQGYEPLSKWINTSSGEVWILVDASAGAAKWDQSTLDISDLGSAAIADVGTGPNDVAAGNDPRFGEWSATIVSQAEAEAGTSTTARKWTAQRVRQAAAEQVSTWWNSTSTAWSRGFIGSANASAGRAALDLDSVYVTKTEFNNTIGDINSALHAITGEEP